MEMERERRVEALKEKKKGCIKSTKGPWIVRRRGRDGAVVSTSWRRPTDREREKNRLREQWRRKVAAKIYAGLREHGNYCLPKHADQNDVLRALCEEAGWHVDEEGNVTRMLRDSVDISLNHSGFDDFLGGSSIGATNLESVNLNYSYPSSNFHEEMRMEINEDELSLNLTLSFKYM